MILVTAGIVFALVGGVALVAIYLGRPGDPAEVVVTPAMPIAVGDRLGMKVDEVSCTVEVLSVLDDGRLLLVPCAGDGVPTATLRSSLRAPLYRREAPEPRPAVGDIVLVPRGTELVRSRVVELRGADVCVRPEADSGSACAEAAAPGLALVRPGH